MAHDLDRVTREAEDGPDKEVLQRLLPQVWDVECMVHSQDVDYLIRLMASPTRRERSRGG